MELSLFNVNHGFTEALARGLRSGFLNENDYRRLGAAESLEDVRSALEETDYGTFLQDEPSPLTSKTIQRKAFEKLADEFRYLKAQTVEPATTFMDFLVRERMIDNVCTIIQGTKNNKAPKELEAAMHPLGIFEGMKVIMSEKFDTQQGDNFEDLYRIFLVDTPIAPYFEAYLEELKGRKTETGEAGVEAQHVAGLVAGEDSELMKACLKKAWLEHFYEFVMGLGGTTAEVMGDLLKTEADNKVLMLVFNSMNGEIADNDVRNRMFPNFGHLYPDVQKELRRAGSKDMVKEALKGNFRANALWDQVDKQLYNKEERTTRQGGNLKSIEELIFEENGQNCEMAFEQQYHFGVFYAWARLREQEIKNIRLIADMVELKKKEQIDKTIVPLFKPRRTD